MMLRSSRGSSRRRHLFETGGMAARRLLCRHRPLSMGADRISRKVGIECLSMGRIEFAIPARVGDSRNLDIEDRNRQAILTEWTNSRFRDNISEERRGRENVVYEVFLIIGCDCLWRLGSRIPCIAPLPVPHGLPRQQSGGELANICMASFVISQLRISLSAVHSPKPRTTVGVKDILSFVDWDRMCTSKGF